MLPDNSKIWKPVFQDGIIFRCNSISCSRDCTSFLNWGCRPQGQPHLHASHGSQWQLKIPVFIACHPVDKRNDFAFTVFSTRRKPVSTWRMKRTRNGNCMHQHRPCFPLCKSLWKRRESEGRKYDCNKDEKMSYWRNNRRWADWGYERIFEESEGNGK